MCSYCGRYGATIKCKAYKCSRYYHYPCAAGCGCYQVETLTVSLICVNIQIFSGYQNGFVVLS